MMSNKELLILGSILSLILIIDQTIRGNLTGGIIVVLIMWGFFLGAAFVLYSACFIILLITNKLNFKAVWKVFNPKTVMVEFWSM
jgi:hypothetical protein